ncbi:hypothetical protein JZK91_11860 [Staphylococcus aureus]|nr:hypothetical protein [Staphylococcus aureus]
MRKLKEDNQVIVYEYIPQDKIEKGILIYRDKSFHAILNFIDENKFPNEYIYAWY